MLEENITTQGYAFHTLAIPKITIAGIEVYDQLPKKSYDMITGEKALKHWIRRGRFKKEAVKEISWSSQMKAMRQAKIGTRRFVTKWANDYVATGKNMKRWRLREHSNCPFYMTENEDVNHISKCKHIEAENLWRENIWKMVLQLKKIGTCHWAIIAIQQELVH